MVFRVCPKRQIKKGAGESNDKKFRQEQRKQNLFNNLIVIRGFKADRIDVFLLKWNCWPSIKHRYILFPILQFQFRRFPLQFGIHLKWVEVQKPTVITESRTKRNMRKNNIERRKKRKINKYRNKSK